MMVGVTSTLNGAKSPIKLRGIPGNWNIFGNESPDELSHFFRVMYKHKSCRFQQNYLKERGCMPVTRSVEESKKAIALRRAFQLLKTLP